MISILQRVTQANVVVDRAVVGAIEHGMVALVSVHRDDEEADVEWTARKILELRIFRSADGQKHFDLDVSQVGGGVLLVSNFTVSAATKKGRRPSFDGAAGGEKGEKLFNLLVEKIRLAKIKVATGVFGADMKVSLCNDGPATFIVDSKGE